MFSRPSIRLGLSIMIQNHTCGKWFTTISSHPVTLYETINSHFPYSSGGNHHPLHKQFPVPPASHRLHSFFLTRARYPTGMDFLFARIQISPTKVAMKQYQNVESRNMVRDYTFHRLLKYYHSRFLKGTRHLTQPFETSIKITALLPQLSARGCHHKCPPSLVALIHVAASTSVILCTAACAHLADNSHSISKRTE